MTSPSTPSGGHVLSPKDKTDKFNTIRRTRVVPKDKTDKFNTIRRTRVVPKDKTDKFDQSGVIYRIDCADCDQEEIYVGETERNLRKRIKEHHRESSPVGAHMTTTQHHFSQDNVSVLDPESRWFQRGVKESIYIAATKPTLHRDRGRHTLPAIYSSLLQSGAVSSAHGDMH